MKQSYPADIAAKPDAIIKRIISKIIEYWFNVINLVSLICRKYPHVYDSVYSLNEIIEKKLSVSRFGDGELMIIRGDGWGFQQYNNILAKRLIEILKSDDPNIAICIPDVFRNRSRFTEVARKFWRNHLLNNLLHWNKYILKDKAYYDTQISRFYMDIRDKSHYPETILSLIRQIWDKKDLLIVEGAGSRLGYNNDLFNNAHSIKRILCPPENAFTRYDEIFDLSYKNADGKLVLIALGMTATVLAYDLAKKGIRAIDIGHVDIEYEWYKMKAFKKVPVDNRYMNEVSCRAYDPISDETYLNQIISTIT
jgi:glycosyltransferase family protein